ncbi:MAG: AAA family ATPase [Desulfitobacteriaceae bacterium]|nr:AAA family ATPase [Desulfitobacteriaceae bacterium]MDI6915368.1 AAA family ATPase [Desulfitobacteriaceae bacterium]
MKKRIAIGVSDFREMLTGAYYYVDKTLFIKNILEDGSKVILLPRPRRFGKTLNMSMLRYFFEKSAQDHSALFENLAISQHADCMDKQGQYPVIYLTFKDLKHNTWKVTYDSFVQLIYTEYNRHLYLMDSPVLSDMDKKYFQRVSMDEGSEADYASSIKKLSEFLTKHHGQKTIILIDEYDVPIQQAYLKQYYDPLISFMRNFMTAALKDNNYLEKAILTGVMRVARESLFSGLNNLSVQTILNKSYSQHFGFIETEVEELLNYYGIESQIEEVRNWYNGYIFGNTVVYNPWSVLQYAQNWEEGFQPYWVNTSDNEMVHRLISRGGPALKMELEDLLQGTPVIKTINQNISMGEVEKNDQNVWSFLLFTGYLKPISREIIDGEMNCNLAIPNREVWTIYRDIVKSWFSDSVHSEFLKTMLKSLIGGQIEVFASHFREYVQSSFSYFDTGGKVPEKIYHAFVLGLLVGLRPDYEIKSNREGGYGRYDVMVIPQDTSQAGIIIEFKSVDPEEVKDLEPIAQLALQQIEAKEYQQELFERGIHKIIKLGIVFRGKEVLVKARD